MPDPLAVDPHAPPDELCCEIAHLFRTCSASLSGAHMALYPTCYREMIETFCSWHSTYHPENLPYQNIRDTELGKRLAGLNLMQHMNGTAAYAAWTVATLIYMQANRNVAEILVPFGCDEKQRALYKHSLIYCLELPYAVAHISSAIIRDFFTHRVVGSDEILKSQPPDVAQFMAGIPCELDRVWGAIGNPAVRPDITQQQRNFFAGLYHRYASLDRA
jgi:hypothetical protein